MESLTPAEYERVRPLMTDLLPHHLCIASTLDGSSPAEVWVDDRIAPDVVYMQAVEGNFLAGAVEKSSTYNALRETIPFGAALILSPAAWARRLDQVWANPFVRRHPRYHYQLKALAYTEWEAKIPADFTLALIDDKLLARTHLGNYGVIEDWLENFHSTNAYLQLGFGACLIHEDNIVSWCMSDCVSGQRCEIGINTDYRYRRRGLAAITVAATVAHCLAEGYTQVGWHCLANNVGSWRTAEKVGFRRVHAYANYSSGFPAENPSDLTAVQWQEWATHFATAADSMHWFHFHEAEAWSLAGEPARALRALETLLAGDWWWPPEQLVAHAWPLRPLHGEPGWRHFLDRLEARRPATKTTK